jgi:hypothetical protein
MIVKSTLPDHWKVRELKRLSGRTEVVEWLIRLWGSCETRRNRPFETENPEVISATCCFDGDPSEFVGWLLKLKFLEKSGSELIVRGWAEYNAQLIASWKNGKRGGRPETHGLSLGNPEVTQNRFGLPDKIRLDKIREEKRERTLSRPTSPPELSELQEYCRTLSMRDSDAEAIHDYWLANGFKTGKNLIRDWKAVVRNWKRRAPQFQNSQNGSIKKRDPHIPRVI